MRLGFAVLSFLASASADTFAAWQTRHHRTYATAKEQAFRATNFDINAKEVEANNAANPHATFALDEWADWSDAELAGLRGGPFYPPKDAEVLTKFDDDAVRSAGPIDWVDMGAVNIPVSQGRCGTCAQFSATADIEAQWYLHGHGLIKLSEQEMIDCSSYTGPYGMGWVASVHKGLATNKTYPLANHSDPTITGCRSPCNMTAAAPILSTAHIDGAVCAGHPVYDNETQMLAWLQHGPLSVSIDASFGGYKSGVISGAGCNHTKVDHAVLLVGYGVDTSTKPWLPYWKIKNSWGPNFGEGGYVRIQAGLNCLGLRGACQAYIGTPPSGRRAAWA